MCLVGRQQHDESVLCVIRGVVRFGGLCERLLAELTDLPTRIEIPTTALLEQVVHCFVVVCCQGSFPHFTILSIDHQGISLSEPTVHFIVRCRQLHQRAVVAAIHLGGSECGVFGLTYQTGVGLPRVPFGLDRLFGDLD